MYCSTNKIRVQTKSHLACVCKSFLPKLKKPENRVIVKGFEEWHYLPGLTLRIVNLLRLLSFGIIYSWKKKTTFENPQSSRTNDFGNISVGRAFDQTEVTSLVVSVGNSAAKRNKKIITARFCVHFRAGFNLLRKNIIRRAGKTWKC